MNVHLIDGTYELFRHFFAVPSTVDAGGNEVGAAKGVLSSVLGMLESGATHLGVATDHVIESFRNELYPGYKTGEGVPAPLMAQFPLLEEALEAMGVVVWKMVRWEADDGLASAAARAVSDARVERVLICSPDKDLAQCVGGRVVQFDRMRSVIRDEAGVMEKFGVGPDSIPDYLALVGDSADGFPGIPGWGAKSAAAVLSRHPHLEDVPRDAREWDRSIRGAARLAAALSAQWEDALLFRTLATLVRDVPVFEDVEELRWRGVRPEFEEWAGRLGARSLLERAQSLTGR